jgi:uncharacterized repeat protein (TIGR01451 family)
LQLSHLYKINIMKIIYPLLLSFFTVFAKSTVKANDTLIHFGQNNAGAAQWNYKGGGTNLDTIAWKAIGYSEPGWLTARSQAFGFGSNPPVRNTAIPTDNTPGGGGASGSRYPTLYFRKIINITALQLASFNNFILQAKFDDAIIVHVNGTEVYRNNISTVPALYSTWADGGIGNSGGDIYTTSIPKTAFIAGNNIIAVEIHQSDVGSSDLFFDFQLIGNNGPNNLGRPFTVRYNNASEKGNILFVANNIITSSGGGTNETPPGGTSTNNSSAGYYIDIDDISTNIFSLGSTWRWNANGAIPAIDWDTTTYNDAAWATGNGEFGYGDGDETTCIPYGCNGNVCNPTNGCNKYWTYYFRKTINISSLAGIDKFLFNYKRDDGIVVYVNGVELFRENMPTGTIAYNTPATTDIANENAIVSYTFNGTAPFIVGPNTIAVEVHQRTQSSSDISFDMGLSMLNSNGTFSSSSADLVLPSSCSEVLFAGLYWGATLGGVNDVSWRAGMDSIKLKIPGSSVFTNVISTQTDIHDFGIPDASQNHVGYSSFADITSLINTNNANGTYTIADMRGPTGYSNCAGGWNIIIAYKDLSDPVPKNLVVFDGAAFVTNSAFVDVPFAGFQTPIIGPVTADFGVLTYDGDRSSIDGFLFKQDSAAAGIYLDMALPANAISTSNSSGDSWNSTVSYLNSVVTTRNPAHENTLGFDADIIRLNNPGNVNLNNNINSARLRLNSAGEKYYLHAITSAISVAVPTFRGGITSTDINGGANFAPGDSLRYTINWQNRGSDTAVNVRIVDTIPQNVVYKRNSLRIGGIAKTDAIGDDEAEWDSVGNRVLWRVGTSATASLGGQVLPNPLPGNSGNVSFVVNAINICDLLVCNATVLNKAHIMYTAKISGDSFSDIIASNATGCASAAPIRDTIIGQCYSQKDSMLNNRCMGSSVVLPVSNYPGYTFYRNMPFIPANVFNPPTTPITTTGIYYAHILTKDGCWDTVVLKVRIVNCLDIDDDNDGIPDYVETMNALAFGDHDLDLVPNWNDAQYPGRVDYNSDGVDDRFDAAADADNDGVPNYYDSDFTFGGSYIDTDNDGVNDRYDTDLDGIINQFDLDSDNDGIPDVVEQGGADTNGDGVIDNYTDTDGDGFSQNVDGSNTGTAGSGRGLDYTSFDTDGLANAIDLDSDNDGLPDNVEALAADINNDGIHDGAFVDYDIDGFTDPIDGDADLVAGAENSANAILRTGGDVVAPFNGRAESYPFKNFDGDFRPNSYDIDSDGDGIMDVIESGLPLFDSVLRWVAAPFGADGWSDVVDAQSILTNRNTDGRGNPDYLDIDSDDDGIPDQIEGQPTADPLPAGYMMPLGTDAEFDGLDARYDTRPALYGGAGISPVDKDGDGIPDYRDLDTDADGQPDIVEGNDFNMNGIADDDVALTFLDTDGDGLDNKFDSSSSIKGTSYNLSNGGYTAGDASPGARCPVQRRLPAHTDRQWRYAGSVLPVQILTFTGKQQGYNALLNWTITTQQTIDRYEVERSINVVNYSKVGMVTKTTLLNVAQQFGYTDDISSLTATTIYYRLKIITTSGEVFYSNSIALHTKPQVSSLYTISPNPAVHSIAIKFIAQKDEPVQFKLMDNTGRLMIVEQRQIVKGANTIQISNLNKLAAGVYVLQFMLNGEMQFSKLIINKQ